MIDKEFKVIGGFTVAETYETIIKAKSEKQARKILVKEGGLGIGGELCEIDERDYRKAELIEIEHWK